MEVYKAIADVAGELAQSGITKDSKNVQQGFMFRGIDAVYNHLAPLLAKHRLVILPRCLEREVVERQTAKGGNLFYVTVKCEFDFVSAVDGTKHTVATFGEAMDSADKATNKAMSAAYKYAAFQSFCIPTEETAQDADAETHQVRPAARPAAKPKEAPNLPPVTPEMIATHISAMEACRTLDTLKAAFAAAWRETNHSDKVQAEYKRLKTILEAAN